MAKRAPIHVGFAVLLLVAACSGDGGSAESSSETSPIPAATTTSASATTTTLEPASSLAPEPPAAAGIWLTELGNAVLQFRLDAGPDDRLTGVFDSLTEGVTDLPVTITADGDDVVITIEAASVVFEGTADGDTLTGVWKQSGAAVPMVFERQAEPFALNRPQEPVPPFPYTATDVRFANDQITLAGTLVIPDGVGPFPAAILISGSGAQDRNESLMGHQPFLVIADALARRGIATLRYDDRGVAESTGTQAGATTADLATDTVAAVEFLDAQDHIGDIGLIGHSEGGLIAPIAAAASDAVRFVVSLAGPGLPGADVLLTQTEDLLRAEGVAEDVIAWRMEWNAEIIRLAASSEPTAAVATAIREVLGTVSTEDVPPSALQQVRGEAIEQFVAAFTEPWMRFFLAYDPGPPLSALEVPVLALIGDLDLQASSRENVPALREALSNNLDATVEELPGLNHLFQNATTGAVSEYGAIEETISPAVLTQIADWILERF